MKVILRMIKHFHNLFSKSESSINFTDDVFRHAKNRNKMPTATQNNKMWHHHHATCTNHGFIKCLKEILNQVNFPLRCFKNHDFKRQRAMVQNNFPNRIYLQIFSLLKKSKLNQCNPPPPPPPLLYISPFFLSMGSMAGSLPLNWRNSSAGSALFPAE
jgi:hypothetical protein